MASATPSPQPAQQWSPTVLSAIEWRRFEALCEAFFAQAGLATRSQSHGADGGVDIWLQSKHMSAPRIVQCKHWLGKPVGVKEMREFANKSLGSLPGVSDLLIETLYAHGFRQSRDIAEANPEVLAQIPGIDVAKIPAMQETARSRMMDDAAELQRMEQEREAARIAEARRHPDELTQAERMARVRGMGEKTIEQLQASGYLTVEDIANEKDLTRLGDVPGVGIKKARQLKSAAENYLLEEAKLRAELNAERGVTTPPPASTTPASGEAKPVA